MKKSYFIYPPLKNCVFACILLHLRWYYEGSHIDSDTLPLCLWTFQNIIYFLGDLMLFWPHRYYPDTSAPLRFSEEVFSLQRNQPCHKGKEGHTLRYFFSFYFPLLKKHRWFVRFMFDVLHSMLLQFEEIKVNSLKYNRIKSNSFMLGANTHKGTKLTWTIFIF